MANMDHPRGCVFAGPSLPPSYRQALPGITYLPPAERGDLEAAARQYDRILLIDGVFHHRLAVSPKECLAACRLVKVFGAASIGAPRAVECAPYGAVPLGIIARWYANGTIDGDDEVAVMTHPQTHAALTVPAVDLRYIARLAVRRGVMQGHEAVQWVRDARERIFYMDRTWDDALALAPSGRRHALAALASASGSLKEHDAVFALRRFARERIRARAT